MTLPTAPAEGIEMIVCSLIRERLATVASLPEPRQWEGTSILPPGQNGKPPAPWGMEHELTMRGPERQSLGDAVRYEQRGVYQWDIHVPRRIGGKALARAIGADIRAAFPDTVDFVRQGVRLRINSVSLLTIDQSAPGWLVQPVSLSWTADFVRPA